MKTTTLDFGKKALNFLVPDNTDILLPPGPQSTIDPSQFQQKLEAFVTSSSSDFSSPAIVLADKTRCCDYPIFLPILAKSLTETGTRPEDISFYIAYGTHARQFDEESIETYGDVYKQYKFIHHQSNDPNAFDEHGCTLRNTPIRLRKDLKKHSCIITFGALSHHYFAGYGGGRKLIFPGLGETEAIYHNHSLFIDQKAKQLHPTCQPGKLEGNPVAEDLQEVVDKIDIDLAIHAILHLNGKVANLILGESLQDFNDACQEHDDATRAGTPNKYDLVLASCGGYPKDINLIQAHKSIHHASLYLRDGGTLIILAECPDGIGSKTFLPWFDHGGFDPALELLIENYQGNGGTALALMTKTKRINILLHSQLPESICNKLEMTPIGNRKIQNIVNAETGKIAILPHAALTLAK